MPWPLYTMPIGMSVVLNLSPKHRSPYKLNVKVYTNISFVPHIIIPPDQMGGGGYGGINKPPIFALLQNPDFNTNLIIPSPHKITIHSNPYDFYTGHVSINAFSFNNYNKDKIQIDNKFIIKSVA
jgi:hypothetical protein